MPGPRTREAIGVSKRTDLLLAIADDELSAGKCDALTQRTFRRGDLT